MDPTRFDALARTLVAATTRRGVVGLLLGAGFAGFDRGALAKTKKKAKKGNTRAQRRRKDKDRKGNARSAGAEATPCCSAGNCVPGKGKNLQKCCYQGQDLTGKNFSGANLGSANLSGATLTGANLQGANLGKACLVDADLRGVKLNSSTNWGGVVYCRTQTDRGENNSGCDKGTDCCPTCDTANPCDDGEICCNGRCLAGNCCDNGEQSTCDAGELCCANTCVAGECCAATDCPNETCQRRSCQGNQCTYEPVAGESGPRCQTVCCADAQGDAVCCDAGIEFCQPNGRCGCGRDTECATTEKCCAGICVDRATCCEGNNAEGCADQLHCCVLAGNGVCRACCEAAQCPDETCQTKSCTANNTCQYTPVLGDDGPGCATICCENANDRPICCPDGTTVCQTSGLCGCQGNQDCAASELCCAGECIANTLCCNGDPSTCPAPGTCQQRACNGNQCQPQGVTGGTCPFASGGTGACNNGACVCPSPRITCSNGCCPPGATPCATDGTCPRGCDVCASGCPFTTLAAAVAGTPAGGTIRICPGTYPTNSVSIDKNLTIVGAGSGSDPATDTILSGGNTNRILTILGATVTIRDLTVTEGKGADRTGGIEVVLNATLTLERVEVVGNTTTIAPTSGNAGGGLGVSAGSTAIIKASRVANNTVQGGPAAVGGGIFNGGTLTVEATRVEGNTARGGGGIFNSRNARLTLNPGAVVTMNTANDPTLPLGSGIYNIGTIIDGEPTQPNVFGNNPSTFNSNPNNCINESPGTGCPA